MQTIIYTNCKRQAANYQVDKICFTDRVDISQLIQEEMNKYNIRNIHFWMITDNILHIESVNQEKLLMGVAKYLTENKDMSFQVQYIVQKYMSYFQTRFTKKESGNETEFSDIKRHKTAMNLTCDPFSQSCPIPNELNRRSQQNAFQLSKSRLIQQQVIKQTLKTPTLQQFQDFLKKEAKFNPDSESIKKFIFKTSSQSITISFIQSNKKNLIKKIIEQNCDRFYDAKLSIKKKSTFQSTQTYGDLFKKFNHNLDTTQTLYNKVILFLFSTDKNQQVSLTRRRTKLMQNKVNPSIQALNQWKIKEENVDIVCKLEKECDLIKQQIQNQKILFRNKIKMIQNFIGETINIQKLMQEQEIQSTNQLVPPVSHQKKQTLGKRASIIPQQVQQIASPSRFSVNTPYVTSEFKRLKDISDAMRNIDNTLLQQNKKIESAQKRIKELIKNKQSLIFSNARELNKLRQSILEAKSEIARKQIQIAQKQKNGTISQILHYKSKEPSNDVKKTLEKYEQFCNNIKIFKNEDPTEDLMSPQNKKRFKMKVDSENRIIHKSLHCKSSNKFNISQQSVNPKLREKRMQQIQASLSKSNKLKQQNFQKMNKIINKQLKIGHQRLNEDLEYTQNDSSNIIKAEQEIKIQKLYQQLLVLFEYYNKNNQIEKEMKTQLQTYKTINQQPLNTFMKQITNKDRSHSRLTKKSLHFSHNSYSSCFVSQSQLQLEDFPILKQYILRGVQTEKNNKKQNIASTRPQSRAMFKQQLKYPRDCFQLMLYGDKKQKKVQTLTKTTTSIKSELYDKIIQEASQTATVIDKNPPPLKQPAKQKRITIEQAIKLSSHFNPHKNK